MFKSSIYHKSVCKCARGVCETWSIMGELTAAELRAVSGLIHCLSLSHASFMIPREHSGSPAHTHTHIIF